MLLYHGTSAVAARKAMTEGLKPRGSQSGNWTHTIESNPKAVYLTDIYAPYFAVNASEGEVAVLEVDTDMLDDTLLHPDEDWLEQNGRHTEDGVKGNMHERTAYYRDHIANWQHHWSDSVSYLGTCSYMGIIPPKAITQVAFWDWEKDMEMAMLVMDAMIMLMNHQIMAGKYRAITGWLMGKPVTPEDIMGALATIAPPENLKQLEAQLRNGHITREVLT